MSGPYVVQSFLDPSRVYVYREQPHPPASRFSMLPLGLVDDRIAVGEDDAKFGFRHVEPSLLNPFTVAFWNWLALKVAAKLLVNLIDPRALSASLDQHLQEDARGGMRRLGDGRYQVRVNNQGLDFVDLRHGVRLHISAVSEARAEAAHESGRAASPARRS